jgi:hypothetical protein
MTTRIQLRRGTKTQHNSFTGATGEVTINTTDNSLHVHDGTTQGGFPAAKSDLANVSGAINLSLSGITTTGSLSIGSTQVISSARQLQNIVSLDATTTATIESAIASGPNDFNSLNVSGVSTFSGITTHTASLFGTQASFSGVVTATTFVGALTGTASSVTTNANLTGDITSSGNATSIAAGVIVNDDINASAGIVDTKLATIATAGKVSNSATTATDANTASAIVARDASGNFSAGTITANLTGTASTTTNIPNLTGAVTSVNTTTSLGSFSSANLATALTDETGSGSAVFATSPTLVTPVLGAASATSIVISSGSTFTNGPVLIGSGTSTGTASQRLQVTGGAYVSGNLGVGNTNPQNTLDVGVGTIRLINKSSTGRFSQIYQDNNLIFSNSSTNDDFDWTNSTGSRMRLYGTGNLVIPGTFTPTGTASQKLQVDGGAYVSGNLGVGNTNGEEIKLFVSQGSPAANRPVALITDDGTIPTMTSGATLRISNDGSINSFALLEAESSVGKLVFTNAGNLGIGTTNPGATLNVVPTATSIAGLFSGTTSSDMVRITQLGTGNALVVEDSANPDSSPFVVKGDGSVGIGTTNPGTGVQLDVVSTTNESIRARNSAIPSGYLFFGVSSSDYGRIGYYNGAWKNIAINEGGGNVTIGSTLDTGTASQPLQVTGGAYVSQNLGIGTTNPTSKLHVVGDVSVSGIITATQLSTGASGTGVNITTNTISGPSILTIDPAAVGDDTGAVRIKGDLYVDGTQFIVNSTTIELADFNVGIATTVGTNDLLDGAGIGIGSTSIRKTLTWSNSSTALKSSEDFDVASGKVYKIAGTSVLSNNTLGSGVVTSSLTSVGTLGSLNVGNVYSTGIITATTFVGALTGTASSVTTNANLTGDVTSTGNATAIAAGVIVDADINASAAIAVSKLAASTISGVILGNNLNVLTISTGLSGSSYNGSGAVTIAINSTVATLTGIQTLTNKTLTSPTLTTPSLGAATATSVNASGIITANSYDIGTAAGISTTITTGITTTAATTIDSFSTTSFRSAKLQIQITQNTDYQASDVLIIHDGTTASIIEYGSIATNNYLGTFNSSVSDGNCLLSINMISATSATVKVLSQRITI